MKIWIEREYLRDIYNVYVGAKHGTRLFVARPVELIFDEVKEYSPGTDIKNLAPFLKVDGLDAHDFFPALAKALAEIGFKDIKDTEQIKDILDATKYHLEDMRKLIFKGKP